MGRDPYYRLIAAGIRPDCALDTIEYYTNHRSEAELEEYISRMECRREESDR